MFDDEIIALLKYNAEVIEIQAEKLAQAARAIQHAIQIRNKHRVLNNIVIVKKTIRVINEEFSEIAFLVE